MGVATLAVLSVLAFSFARRDGIGSFGFLFVATTSLYLVVIPLSIGGYDVVTGANAIASGNFYVSVFLYVFFVLLGMRLSGSLRSEIAISHCKRFRRTGPHIVYKSAFLLLTISFVSFSIITRNVFNGGSFLFTILGFDFLLVYYLLTRSERLRSANLLFFMLLLTLFFFAGFRYRIAILILSEAFAFQGRGKSVFRDLGFALIALVTVFSLAAYGQIRSYGNFVLGDFLKLEFNPLVFITKSGEQTVSLATISVIENLSNAKLVGMEPFIISLTHFVPSALWPNKPRVSYLDAYFDFTDGLANTGTAMHDLAQAALMFGFIGLPLSALMLGLFYGVLLRVATRYSPTAQFTKACVVLFAVFIPTRGYLPQQMTWALTFLLPVVFFHFSSRAVWRKGELMLKAKRS